MTIHVATSRDLGRTVRRALREPVLSAADNWLVGPCEASPELHAEARCDYFRLRGRDRARFLRSFREITEAIGSDQRVVLWTSRLGSDTVALWALCAWRLARWPAAPNFDLVTLGGLGGPGDVAGVEGGFIRVTSAEVRQGASHVHAVSLSHTREMASQWRKLSGRSPILGGRGCSGSPDGRKLLALGDYQAGFFPRLGLSGAVLSSFDELLFSALEKGWSTAADVFVSRGPSGEELRRIWLPLTGDVFLSFRLAQWASHGKDAAALQSEHHRADNVMMSARYRLSDSGRAIRQSGLASVSQAPPLRVWGATAYDPLVPWVVAEEPGDGQILRRLAPQD